MYAIFIKARSYYFIASRVEVDRAVGHIDGRLVGPQTNPVRLFGSSVSMVRIIGDSTQLRVAPADEHRTAETAALGIEQVYGVDCGSAEQHVDEALRRLNITDKQCNGTSGHHQYQAKRLRCISAGGIQQTVDRPCGYSTAMALRSLG